MADVLRAWTDWHPRTPETMISSFAVLRMPVSPEDDRAAARKFFVCLRIAYTGTSEDGERMIAPLRAVAPAVFDTVADMPYTAVASIHNEPIEPVPYYERSITLREFPAVAQDKLVELVGPDSKTGLCIAELRALGGAWDRKPAVPNAVATRACRMSCWGVAAGPLSEEFHLKRSVAELLDGMESWRGERRMVNNLAPDEAADAVAIYGPERYLRLASIKKVYDPANMFRLNHNVVPAALMQHRLGDRSRMDGCSGCFEIAPRILQCPHVADRHQEDALSKAVIIGVGPDRGLGAQLCKRFAGEGLDVVAAGARKPRWTRLSRISRDRQAKLLRSSRTPRARLTWLRCSDRCRRRR